jgi:hypothetical protein
MGGQVIAPADPQAYRGLWEDLFYDFQQDKPVSIKVHGNPNSETRTLSIQYVAPVGVQELPFEKQASTSTSTTQQQLGGMPQVEFSWKRTNYPKIVSRPKMTSNGLQFDVPEAAFFPCWWSTPGVPESPDDNAKRFSELDKKGESNAIWEVLAREFNFIEGLSIDYHAGHPMVFAKLDGKSRKFPIPLVSDGVNRLMGICLGIASFKGGTVLIDQIEDGFHHKLLPSIWKSIYTLATTFNVQLFVSTHSAECIRAMLPIIKGHEDDFCLLRSFRKESGCGIDSLTGKYLESAVEQDFEVR